MTSVMIVHDIDLLRGAIAAVLSHELDIEVIAQVGPTEDVLAVALDDPPDVAIVHVDHCDPASLRMPRLLRETPPNCQVLLISGRPRAEDLRIAVEMGIRGFLSEDTAPESLVDAVRRLSIGEWVIDPVLLGSALRGAENPLTDRQRDVLRLAAEGLSSRDIGSRLFLSPGTVRNYLSAAIRRAGGRSVLEAAGRARTHGWL